tara:strand:+ start:330 stop:596 length:267 start_codon:yes stop_codon:yes gene_type:complete
MIVKNGSRFIMPSSNNVKRIWKPIIEDNHPILSDVLASAVTTAHDVSKGINPATKIRDVIIDEILDSIPEDANNELLEEIQGSAGAES